jgi:AraC-binding-like domain
MVAAGTSMMADAARSLDRFPLVRTRNSDEMCAALERIYAKPVLGFAAQTKEVDVAINYLPVNYIGLGNTKYGIGVSLIYPDSDVIMQTFPVAGRGEAAVDHFVGPLNRWHGVIVSPGMKFTVKLAGSYETLLLVIKPQALLSKLAAITGRSVDVPLRFDPLQDYSRPAAKALREHFLFLVEMVGACAAPLPKMLLAEYEETLAVMCLHANRHNHSHLLERPTLDVALWQVRLAEEYIAAHRGRAISIEELADVTGVSALSLFRSFKRNRGYSPRQFMTRLRSGR